MIHYVKEAKEEACKTVERFTEKKNDCLIFLRALQTCEGLLRYCKVGKQAVIKILFIIIPRASKENK